MLVDEQGKPVNTQLVLDVKGKEWTKLTGTLKPDKDVKRGMLAIQPLGKGQFNWMSSLYSLLIHGTMENQFFGRILCRT